MSAGHRAQRIKYEFVAPEGGWGYMICASFIINISLSTCFNGCFGMIYNDLILELKLSSTTISLISGLYSASIATSGFFTVSLLKIMSQRKLAIIAALFLNVGTIGMIFIRSTILFFIFQGLLPGIHFGISFNLSCSVINQYFVQRRMFAFSLVQFFNALILMLAPLYVEWSLSEYGYRGTRILIAGLSLNNLLAVMLLQPVQWHMKRVQVLGTKEIEPLIIDESPSATIKIVKITDENNGTRKINKEDAVDGEKSKLRKFIETFMDPNFFVKFLLSCACVGPAVCNFAEFTFCVFLPQAFYALGWNEDKVALALSVCGFGDLAMRTAFIFTSKWLKKVGSQELYIIALALTCVAKIGMTWSENDVPIFIFLVLIGMARAFIYVLVNVVISEEVPPEKFTEAMGFFMILYGVALLTLGPAVGAIRDLTNSYSTAFYLLTSCSAIILLLWSVELIYKKKKGKREYQNNTKAESNQSINKGL